MKKILLTISFILLIGFNSNAQNIKNILFIGNSITYFNNMPQTFESIANDKGDAASVTVYAPGGTGFINLLMILMFMQNYAKEFGILSYCNLAQMNLRAIPNQKNKHLID